MPDLTAGRSLVRRWRSAPAGLGDTGPGPHPLTHAQHGIWLFERLHPESAVFNLTYAAEHTGSLDRDRLDRALATLLDRHPALRSTFAAGSDGPGRTVAPAPAVHADWVDLRAADPTGRPAATEASVARVAARPFDLTVGPLVRLQVIRSGDRDSLLVLVAHHLVCDGGSLAVLLRELAAAYDGQPLPPPVTTPPPGPVDAAALDWWRTALAGLPTLDLPGNGPPGRPTFGAVSVPVRLPVDLLRGVERLAVEEAVTPFAVLLAAYQVLLGRHAGQTDFAVGTLEAGRAGPGLYDAVGLLANPLVLRADLGGRPGFRALVRRAHRTFLDAYAHRRAPLEEVVAAIAPGHGADRPPLAQAYLVYHGDRAAASLAGSPLTPVPVQRPGLRHDLELHLWRTPDGLDGVLDVSTDRFDPDLAERVAERWPVLLAAVLADPDRPVARLDIRTGAEQARVLAASAAPGPELAPGLRLFDLVGAQARRTPDATAVTDGRRQLSYRELEARANQLAARLRADGVGPHRLVGLQLRRDVDMVVAMLGVLKTGAGYVPLDPAYPAERLRAMQGDAGVDRVLTTLDDLELADQPDTEPVEVAGGPEDLAYVLYTSGSTGRPKGVMITHGSAVRLVEWLGREFGPDGMRRALAATSVSFDVSVAEIFGPLSVGGTVVVVDNVLALLAPDAPSVTMVTMVPSAARELVNSGALSPSVRIVGLGGEAPSRAIVTDLAATGTVERIYNLYGPTEDTTYSTFAVVAPGATPGIGRPLPGERAYVLDAELQPVPVGVVGELYLGGPGLARGYVGQPAATAERFVADTVAPAAGRRMYRTGDLVWHRPDGSLAYLGRRDLQVKVRGQRIELGEIESVLQGHPDVADCVVAVPDRHLVGYLTVPAGGDVDLVDVRAHLRARLPETMVPQHLVVLPALPRTSSGKVDRLALPAVALAPATAVGAPPQGPREELVAAVWREVLEVAVVDRRDDFFDLGGHSLLSTQVLNRLRRRVGVDLPLALVLEHSVLADLAAALPAPDGAGAGLENTTGAGATIPRAPRRPAADGTLVAAASRGQESLWLFSALDPGAQRAYTIQGGLSLTGPLQVGLLEAALTAVVMRHEVLRTTFRVEGDRIVQVIHPEPRVDLVTVPVADEAGLQQLAEGAYADLDLADGPLLRVHLADVGGERHVLLLTVHHIVADGWSLAALSEQIGTAYAAALAGRPAELPDLVVQYADYADWQNQALADGAFAAGLAYWRNQLDGLAQLDLFTDHARPAQPSYQGALVRHRIPAALADRLRCTAADHRATVFPVLLAPFLVLLQRHSGQRDVAVGVPVAGRFRHELEPLVGLFVNAVVLRTQIRDDDRARDLLDRVRRVALEAFTHQEVPLEAIVDQQRLTAAPGSPPLFNVMFNYLSQPAAQLEVPGLQVQPYEPTRPTTKFDLELYLEDAADGSIELALCLNQGLFTLDTGRLLLEQYGRLVAQLVDDPDQPVGRLRLDASAAADPPRSAPAGPPLVGAGVAARVTRHPRRAAVRSIAATSDYRALDEAVRALAARIRARLPGRGGRVAVVVRPGPDLAVAWLGVLASGHGVRWLPTGPDGRLRERVDPLEVDLVLAGADQDAAVAALAAGSPVLALAVDAPADGPAPDGAEPEPDEVAWWLGGAAGLSHAALAAHVQGYLATTELDPADQLVVLPEAAAEPVALGVLAALQAGATCYLVESAAGEIDGDDGAAAVRHPASTVIQATAAELRRLLATGSAASWSDSLRAVVLVGPPVEADLLTDLRAVLPQVQVVSGFGVPGCPWALVHVLGPGAPVPSGAVPLGLPVPGVVVDLEDEQSRPGDVVGEIVCRGPHVAPTGPDRVASAGDGLPAGLRTGVLARRRADGALIYQGRRDRQVRVAGYRVDLDAVEARLRAEPEVSGAVVVPVTDENGEVQLVGYVVAAVDPAELRSRLRAELPAWMVPRLVVPVAALPATEPAEAAWSAAPAPSDPPATPEEQSIADAISAELGVAVVGRHDNFFELGGNSLQATRLVTRLRRELALEVSVQQVFTLGTAAQLAAVLAPARPAIPVRAPDADPVLSFDQHRLWLDQLLRPGVAYHVHGRARLTGPLDREVLARSIAAVVARHETLRTRYPLVDGVPVPEVDPASAGWTLPVHDLGAGDGRAPSAPAAEADRLADDQAAAPFDLAVGPLFRCLLIAWGPQDHMLSITIHHIVSDAWSIGVFLRELSALYAAGGVPERADLTELSFQYRDFAVWQAGHLAGAGQDGQIEVWRRRLAGATPVLALPATRRLDSTQGVLGGRVQADLPVPDTTRLHELGRRLGTTSFMALVAAFGAVLGRWSGQPDLVIGAPVSTRSHVGTGNLIGFFVNTLPLRVDLAGEPTFAGLLARVRDTVTEAYGGNAETPFDMVVNELQLPRDPVRTPLFQAVVNMLEDVEADLALPGLEVEVGEIPALPKMFDLTLTAYEQRSMLRLDLVFYADRYDAVAMQALLDQVVGLLAAAVEDPERAVADHALAGAPPEPGPESWADPDPGPDPTAATLDRSVRAVAEVDPGRVAVTGPGAGWSYGRLDRAADRVAAALAGRTPAPGPVVVLRRSGPALAAALVGCARAGRPCVVVPADQAAFHPTATVLDPDEVGDAAPDEVTDAGTDAALAGATPYAPVPTGAEWTAELDLTAADRVAVLGAPARHLVLALTAALAVGAQVDLTDWSPRDDPAAVVARLDRDEVSTLALTAPVLRDLLVHLRRHPPPRLRRIVVDHGVDVLAHDVDRVRQALPNGRWVSTRTRSGTARPLAVWSAPDGWTAADAPLQVPLGTAPHGAPPLVLRGPAGRPVATGELGAVADGSSRGDWGRRRPDGVVELAGGIRPGPGEPGGAGVDPLDVVGALRDRPEVQDALVSDHIDLDGQVTGVAYVACPETPVDQELLRQHLTTLLPETALPAHLVVLDRFPLTADGEHDLAALPDPDGRGVLADTYRAPQSPVEEQLVAVFEELTAARRIGVDDTFFELHGFSLLATQLVSRIRQDFGVTLPLRQVFESQTVGGLAALIVRAQLESMDPGELGALLDQLDQEVQPSG